MNYQDHSMLLNDLIRINNDRIAGYEKITSELREGYDSDLKILFSKMILNSNDLNADLSKMVSFLGGEPATGTTGSGKLYRLWLDIKSAFTITTDRKTALKNGEQIEDAVQSAYDDALNEPGLPAEIETLLLSQKASLLEAHNQIKVLRDLQPG
ncbi:PA2169 family four-helix-bundle protein [Niabella sp. CC-SYL272]|uniref:PA2169 family four-helix-bundle protein n=1 Tax=Niabella agricola TaxID=2891571 RepID=UPI001F2685B6|nr:PA2169 family four-helix-bundle protein [Niabella agricola]MCF3108319.1 PA2169 family four-helix-bundle protein [Niabella agricola]